MPHPTEHAVTEIVATLRSGKLPTDVESDARLGTDAYFNWDTEQGEVTVALDKSGGCLMRMDVSVARAPRWFTFNIALGRASFVAGDVIGLVADLEGGAQLDAALTLRTARGGKTVDTAIRDRLAGASGRSVRSVLHTVEAMDPVQDGEGYHTLMVALPHEDFALSLFDLRMFVLPASRGLRSVPPRLASYAS